MSLNALAEAIHRTAVDKGFWDHADLGGLDMGSVPNPSIYEEKLMLIVSEAAEVLEARRDGDPAAEQEECADIIIRVLDYCAARGFNIEQAVGSKMIKNANRPRLHGRNGEEARLRVVEEPTPYQQMKFQDRYVGLQDDGPASA